LFRRIPATQEGSPITDTVHQVSISTTVYLSTFPTQCHSTHFSSTSVVLSRLPLDSIPIFEYYAFFFFCKKMLAILIAFSVPFSYSALSDPDTY